MLPSLTLVEPLITATVNLMQTSLPGVINSLNATITDGYTVQQPVQYLDYVPVPSTLESGMPIIGVREMTGEFMDDLQSSMDEVWQYAVMAIVQNSDQRSLSWQLRRTAQAIAYTIQQDRLANPGLLRAAGAYSVNFQGTEPGPLYGEPNLSEDGQPLPPTSFMSYTAVIFNSRKQEV